MCERDLCEAADLLSSVSFGLPETFSQFRNFVLPCGERIDGMGGALSFYSIVHAFLTHSIEPLA